MTKENFSPLLIGDNINKAFRARGVEGPVVDIVAKTRKDNLAITTTERIVYLHICID